MRALLATLLIPLLASCPILCATAEAATPDRPCCTHEPTGDDGGSVPYPVNDDDCLCNGALKADDTAPRVSNPAELPSPPDASPQATPLAHPRASFVPDASTSLRALAPARYRALLQHFRC